MGKIDVISEAGKEAITLVINKTTGDNHPEYEKAVIEGTAEAIKDLAKSDSSTAVRIYENIKAKREQRNFLNFSKVLHKFALLIKTKPKEVIADDNDFFWNTLEYAKEISHEEMQELIAKILASEYSSPKTYSLYTLQTMKSIDAMTLKDFIKILSLNLNDSGIFKEIFSDSETIRKLGLNYLDFLNLQNIGLISSNDSSIVSEGFISDIYIDKLIRFKPKNPEEKTLTLPDFYCLTKAGRELAQHLEIPPNQDYIDWVKARYGNRFVIEIT